MDYNTQRTPLLMPEYGRMVQRMVDEAINIENRAERQAYAEAIIGVMRGLNPQMKNVPGYHEKLWDHLAHISSHKLDIDYPCEIHSSEQEEPPTIPYPKHSAHYLHYGALIERALKEVESLPQSQLRNDTLRGIGTRMKRCIADFRSETSDDRRIEHDIERISDGAVTADFSTHPLATIKVEMINEGKKRKKK